MTASSFTSAQEQVVEVLRHGGKLTGKRDRRKVLTELQLTEAFSWQKEQIHASTVCALLRREQIQEMPKEGTLKDGSQEVRFVIVRPWE